MLKYAITIIFSVLLNISCYAKDNLPLSKLTTEEETAADVLTHGESNAGKAHKLPKEAEIQKKSSDLKIKEYSPQNIPDDVAIFDADGKKHYLEEYEGKTLLLVFWATWCAPCVNEMVDLDILQKDFRKLDFIILPISQDYGGVELVTKFYDSYDLRHLALLHDYKNSLFKAFGIVGLPTSILVNSEGKAVATFSGQIHWYDDKIRELLLEHIPNNPVAPKNSYKDNSLNQSIKHPSDNKNNVENEALGNMKGENSEQKNDK